MIKILLSVFTVTTATSLAYAQIYDRGVTHKPNVINPYASQQIKRPQISGKTRPSVSGQKMRFRKKDNNAAVNRQVGPSSDASVPGRKKAETSRKSNASGRP